jgi:hypothetical protein
MVSLNSPMIIPCNFSILRVSTHMTPCWYNDNMWGSVGFLLDFSDISRWNLIKKNIYILCIKDLIMWHHYDVILENSDITMRPWQCLAISDNLNLLSAYVIWNILVLNIKGKVNKIAIFFLIKFHREISQ